MKKWESPIVSELGIDKTFGISDDITTCYWNEAETLGLGNEDYTDPNKKPSQHPTWVWCHVHNRWHPKDHGTNVDSVLS